MKSKHAYAHCNAAYCPYADVASRESLAGVEQANGPHFHIPAHKENAE